MLIGVPKEIKADEYRVGMIPATVRELTDHGHEVWMEARAGEGAGISDERICRRWGENHQQRGSDILARCADRESERAACRGAQALRRGRSSSPIFIWLPILSRLVI